MYFQRKQLLLSSDPRKLPLESEISSYANLGSENLISETDRLNSGGKPDMSDDNGSLFFHTDFS
ncbi:hypothetical protein HKBW3S03_00964 [Candidatus Hakubella thermalkaliphila]|uniref:Uncharacterized protein n=1 Tax=Candidatus Hakubella thermalkaliphila TaxID=2754717 RepID=A0A6V8PDL0_9ACTN|nr:hypothetical protein HKBW3S03_00964 [Candidatus Hakubella thermalkaliphila]GFP22561.1 hypothetical protein HKBW3S09_00028 [Candidatus Hakubella thermalkaliphila]GFP30398.1 hypothetical protein HKBW3S34_01319 [Candidatus Hakubella thermalkaliphila]GFP36580.1 hypothetical protein HKBW3S44_00263 [Candidatus Hakubella thermalkaliphila]GFP38479.1 hypothetical protein HKBW3S47_00180 [Candidatus Hakubella thermalkaliphila]